MVRDRLNGEDLWPRELLHAPQQGTEEECRLSTGGPVVKVSVEQVHDIDTAPMSNDHGFLMLSAMVIVISLGFPPVSFMLASIGSGSEAASTAPNIMAVPQSE